MQKILIIEDDRDIATIERDYLELNDYQVEIAADGLAGLERGLHGDFDLILLDLMLPGMDGFSVCRFPQCPGGPGPRPPGPVPAPDRRAAEGEAGASGGRRAPEHGDPAGLCGRTGS